MSKAELLWGTALSLEGVELVEAEERLRAAEALWQDGFDLSTLAQEKGILGLPPYLYSTLGEIALTGNELERAEALFQEGLTMAERFAVPERVAGLNANLALVALKRDDQATALQRLKAALLLADELGAHYLAAQIRLWSAPLLPPQHARQFLEEARRIAEKSGSRRLIDSIINVKNHLAVQ